MGRAVSPVFMVSGMGNERRVGRSQGSCYRYSTFKSQIGGEAGPAASTQKGSLTSLSLSFLFCRVGCRLLPTHTPQFVNVARAAGSRVRLPPV